MKFLGSACHVTIHGVGAVVSLATEWNGGGGAPRRVGLLPGTSARDAACLGAARHGACVSGAPRLDLR